MRRSREPDPYRESASTQAQGAPASSAAAIRSRALSGLVAQVISSGPPAFGRLARAVRARPAVPARGRGARGGGGGREEGARPEGGVRAQEHANLTVLDP